MGEGTMSSKSFLASAALVNALAAGLIAASTFAASADVVLSDGDFNNITLTSSFGSATITTLTPCMTCGVNGGLGLEVQFVVSLSGTSGIGFVDNLLSYNPSTQGAIASIGASVAKNADFENVAPGTAGNTFRPMIVQDGNFYLAAIAGNNFSVPGSTGYLTLSQSGLIASDFLSFNFNTGTFGSTNPNFAGDPLLFGIGQIGTFSGSAIATASYDNLNFTITVPGPNVGAGLPGLILAGGVLLLLARRRRQQTA
jgi:hypothetical protein